MNRIRYIGPWKRAATLWCTLLAAIALVGCSMVDSTEFQNAMGDFGCDDDAGAYFLSKGVIKIDVIKINSKDILIEKVAVHAVPDQRHGYCLNFRASPTHKERLYVIKSNGLLQQISSIAEDKTPDIVNNLIDTVFTGLSRDPGFSGRSAIARGQFEKEFSAEFDPFDEYQTAVLNDALNDFGICMILQEAHWLQEIGYGRVGAYCENPLDFVNPQGSYKDGGGVSAVALTREKAIYESQRWREAKAESTHVPYTKGVLYRPRLTYTLMVYVKNNAKARYPGSHVSWDLRKQQAVALENIAPILAVGVDRTFFAKRKTTLNFNAGALVDVDINKESELAGFVTIPLNLVENIVKLPTKIVQVRINNTNNRAAIIDAQTQLINLEEKRRLGVTQLAGHPQAGQLGQFRSTIVHATAGPPGRSAASDAFSFTTRAACRDQCRRDGSGEEFCRDSCECVINSCIPNNMGRVACDNFCTLN